MTTAARGPVTAGRAFLGRHPLGSAVLYSVIGTSPLFLISAQIGALDTDIGFSRSVLGVSVSVFFGVAALVSGSFARRSDGINPGPYLRWTALVTAGALIAAASAASWYVIPAVFVVAGSANALSQVASNVTIAHEVAARRKGLAFGAKQASVPIASLAAGAAVPLLGLRYGWRAPLVVFAIVAAAAATLSPDYRAHGGVRPHDRGAAPERVVRVLAVATAAGGAAGSGLSVFVVDGATTAGMSTERAAWLLVAGSLASIAMRLAAGVWVDGRESSGISELTIMAVIGTAAFAVLAFPPSTGVFAAATIVAFCTGWGFSGLAFHATARLGARAPGRATSIVQSGAWIGPTVGPLLYGVIADRAGYRWTWLCGCFLIVLSLAALLQARRMTMAADQARRMPRWI